MECEDLPEINCNMSSWIKFKEIFKDEFNKRVEDGSIEEIIKDMMQTKELNYMTFLASKASDNNLPVYLNTKNFSGSYVSIVPYVQTINLEKNFETMVYQRDELNYPNYSII